MAAGDTLMLTLFKAIHDSCGRLCSNESFVTVGNIKKFIQLDLKVAHICKNYQDCSLITVEQFTNIN